MPSREHVLDGAPTVHGWHARHLASVFTNLSSPLPGGQPHEEEETKVRTRGGSPKATQLGRVQGQLAKVHSGTLGATGAESW